MFKFKPSDQKKDTYNIHRVLGLSKLEEIGTVSIVLGQSYTVTLLKKENMSSNDLEAIKKQCKKLAKIKGEYFYTEIKFLE